MAELSKTESGLVTYFLDQLYVVKSKIQQLEKGGKKLKLALSSCERRIKVVENRKYMVFFSKCHWKIKQNYLYDIKQNLYLYNN